MRYVNMLTGLMASGTLLTAGCGLKSDTLKSQAECITVGVDNELTEISCDEMDFTLEDLFEFKHTILMKVGSQACKLVAIANSETLGPDNHLFVDCPGEEAMYFNNL